jgi:Family of unknown function (DUF5317)
MRLAGFTVALGLLAGLVGGGSVHHLRKFALKHFWLGMVWVVGSVASAWMHGTSAVVTLFVATMAGAALAALNALRWPGLVAVAVGLALNAMVLASNGGFPYDPGAAESAGLVEPGPVLLRTDGITRPQRDGDTLLWLSRRIPVAPLRAVTSVGDMLLALGFGLAVFHATIDKGKARPHKAKHKAGLVSSSRIPILDEAQYQVPPPPAPIDIALQVANAADDPAVLIDLTSADESDPHLVSELVARSAVRSVLNRHGLPAVTDV